MSSELMIQAEGLGKRYGFSGPASWLGRILRRPSREDCWALRGLDLALARGETLGVIGPNGSGKSTLLQILAGTLTPTTGRAAIRGRLSALLELGSGFDPEFTGRENVQLYAGILGLSPREIEKRFDAIAAFAGLGDFIDRPLKTYSTGMAVRLAFAAATSVDPDVLLIDEALAVGDARFQQRCIARIRQLQERGTSILLVSHDLEAIKRLCRRVLVLDHGRLIRTGTPDAVVNWYLGWMTEQESGVRCQESEVRSQESGFRDSRPEASLRASGVQSDFAPSRHGDGSARIASVELLTAGGRRTDKIRLGDEARVRIAVEFFRDLPGPILGFYLRDRLGTDLIGVNTHQEETPLPAARPGDRLQVEFTLPLRLRPGHYSISPALAYNQHEMRYLDWIDHALVFEIVDPRPGKTVFGLVCPEVRVEVKQARAEAPLAV